MNAERAAVMNQPEREFYLTSELARALRVHPETVKRHIRAGRIKAVWAGLGWRIPADEFRRVLRDGVACPT